MPDAAAACSVAISFRCPRVPPECVSRALECYTLSGSSIGLLDNARAAPYRPDHLEKILTSHWRLNGKVLVACNCDWGCPCNFNARPTTGKCEGGWTWQVEQGAYDDVRLDGLNFSVYVNWPGAIHEGGGEALLLIDERADASQRAAIETLLGGTVGGPWGTLAWTWPTVHGPYAVAYELEFDGVRTRVRCGDDVEIECAPIRNPVNGAESFPAVMLPQGIIFKRGDLGVTTRFRVAHGIEYDHSGQYMALGLFDYASP